MKKMIKILILVSAFAMPTIASSKCLCYDTFNSAFNAATAMFMTCAGNYTTAPIGSWANFASGNYGGAGGNTASAFVGFLNCQNTYYQIWDQLGSQFDYCIEHNCIF